MKYINIKNKKKYLRILVFGFLTESAESALKYAGSLIIDEKQTGSGFQIAVSDWHCWLKFPFLGTCNINPSLY